MYSRLSSRSCYPRAVPPAPPVAFGAVSERRARGAHYAGGEVSGTATSTLFWTIYHAVPSDTPPPHAPCDLLFAVPMRIGC